MLPIKRFRTSVPENELCNATFPISSKSKGGNEGRMKKRKKREKKKEAAEPKARIKKKKKTMK